jgi:hypothetical protein
MQQLIQGIFSLSDDIRYVAVYRDGKLTSSVKHGMSGANSSESDKYEEGTADPFCEGLKY